MALSGCLMFASFRTGRLRGFSACGTRAKDAALVIALRHYNSEAQDSPSGGCQTGRWVGTGRTKAGLLPFVPLLISTINTPAWRALSHGAQALYVALKRRYNNNLHNNGNLFLSQRKAAQELASHHNQIARWFRELQHSGFIVQTKGAYLGLEGKWAPTIRVRRQRQSG